jgi:hypothetical protein
MAETREVRVRGEVLDEPAAPKATKQYKVRQGRVHSSGGRTYREGETVELTEAQARAFGDKFESVDESPFMTRQASGPGVEEDFEESDEEKQANTRAALPTSHTPQDIGAKTVTPGQADANPGNRKRVAVGPVPVAPAPAVNPGDQETQGMPPIRDSYTAAVVGGTVSPVQVVQQKEADVKTSSNKSAKSASQPETPEERASRERAEKESAAKK